MLDSPARRQLLAACAAAVLLCTPVAAQAERPFSPAHSASSAGALLMRRVQKAYARVPGLITAIRGGGVDAQFTEVLQHGVVVSEGYVGSANAGMTKLVSTNGSPTYAEEPGTSCWRRLARSAPQTLTDIGHPLLYMPGATIIRSQAVANGWVLRLSQNGTTARINVSKRFLVQTVTVTHGEQRAVETFITLAKAPKLPNPHPRCG